MILVGNGFTESANRPRKLSWAQLAGSDKFVVLRDDKSIIVDADYKGERFTVFDRIIRHDEIIPTVRLYLDVHGRRKTLNDAPAMIIRSIA
jgi:hypothetical protein